MIELQAEVEQLTELQTLCSQGARACREAEDIESGIFFPQEIYTLQQEKNMLETHKQWRVARINRLKA